MDESEDYDFEALTRHKSDWPSSVEEAVALLLEKMSESDKDAIRKTEFEKLSIYHHGWGTGIRNDFGLWLGNRALLLSSGGDYPDHPDDCSMLIIERVWEKLQTN